MSLLHEVWHNKSQERASASGIPHTTIWNKSRADKLQGTTEYGLIKIHWVWITMYWSEGKCAAKLISYWILNFVPGAYLYSLSCCGQLPTSDTFYHICKSQEGESMFINCILYDIAGLRGTDKRWNASIWHGNEHTPFLQVIFTHQVIFTVLHCI